MNARHRAREVALQILYRYDSGGSPGQDELIQELTHHFDHFHVPQDLREFSAQLVSGTLLRQSELDGQLEKQVANWKVTRLGCVDRSLLRMAAYELAYVKETPPSVVIDEAVELAKQFGTEDTPAFVNGVLDGLKKSPRSE